MQESKTPFVFPSSSTSPSVTRDDLDDESELKGSTGFVANDSKVDSWFDAQLDSTRHEAFVIESVKKVADLILCLCGRLAHNR